MSFNKTILSCIAVVVLESVSMVAMAVTKEQNLDLSCASCSFSDIEYKAIPQDTELTCAPERMYLNADLQKLKSQDSARKFFVNRETADLSEAQFPKKCMHFAMKHFVENIFSAQKKAVPNFATCDAMDGVPVHGHWGPCMTEDYINVIYNSFMDVTACLGLPQRNILPKLMNESGFHLNTFAPLRVLNKSTGKINPDPISYPFPQLGPDDHVIGGDSGIGQLTGPALVDIKDNLEEWKSKILNSKKPSCVRAVQFMKSIPEPDEVQSKLPYRCSLIHTPENPMLSLIYYGVLYKTIERNLEYRWKSLDVDELLEKSGLQVTDEQIQKIKDMLVLLAYNAGANESVGFFENWLKSRIERVESSGPVVISDLDFSVDLPKDSIAVLNSEGNVESLPIVKLSSRQADALIKEYEDLAEQEQDNEEALSDVQKTRLELLRKVNIHKLSFPIYLRIYRQGYAKGYLSYLRAFAYTINKNIGSNVCTDDSFLTFR